MYANLISPFSSVPFSIPPPQIEPWFFSFFLSPSCVLLFLSLWVWFGRGGGEAEGIFRGYWGGMRRLEGKGGEWENGIGIENVKFSSCIKDPRGEKRSILTLDT